jgi:hypothetical protein
MVVYGGIRPFREQMDPVWVEEDSYVGEWITFSGLDSSLAVNGFRQCTRTAVLRMAERIQVRR